MFFQKFKLSEVAHSILVRICSIELLPSQSLTNGANRMNLPFLVHLYLEALLKKNTCGGKLCRDP